jgi:hypothetical protein
MKIAAAFVYWVIVAVWLAVLAVVLVLYFRKVRAFGATRVLLAVVAIDTLRNIVENIYFGLYSDARYGFLPPALIDALGKPIFLLGPKILNVVSGCLVMSILLLRWLPQKSMRKCVSCGLILVSGHVGVIDHPRIPTLKHRPQGSVESACPCL